MELELDDGDIRAALRRQLGTADFALDSWQKVSLMEDGRLGFLGDHFKVTGRVRQPADDAAAPRDFSFFVKAVPRRDPMRTAVLSIGAYKKEALFYKLLADDLAALLARDRGAGFQRCVFPLCHLIKDECMLLDDLSRCGFTVPAERQELSLDHIQLVVRSMGEFHAGSLALEERRGARLPDMFPELDYETFFVAGEHPNAGWHRASFRVAVAVVPHLDKYRHDAALVARVQAALPDLLAQMFPGVRAWPDARNAMAHGDLWLNNLMFRHDAEGRPLEVALIDFQLLRYTPPAHDLVMFVLFCTDRAFQERHFADLARLHWDSMAATLRQVGLDPDKVLSWPDFEDSVKRMWKIGLIQMVLEHPIALAPSWLMTPVMEDPVRYRQHCHEDRTEAIIKLYHEDDYFRRRFTETMERLIDGYILNEGA